MKRMRRKFIIANIMKNTTRDKESYPNPDFSTKTTNEILKYMVYTYQPQVSPFLNDNHDAVFVLLDHV